MIFEITKEQEEKIREWKKTLVYSPATIGGAFEFCFTPTGLGMIIIVKCVNGQTLNLTEDEIW